MNKNKIRIGIIGGAGYAGGELIRILLKHPVAEIVFVQSNSNSGKAIYTVHHDLFGECSLSFTLTAKQDIDVIFLCTDHGMAGKFLSENNLDKKIKIIDLSQDFRLRANAKFGTRNFVYGLPELNRNQITIADSIANPGCFATAIQLGLLPLAKAGLLENVYTTGITGSTGAGQSLSPTTHFSWRANNIQAYKTFKHQHLQEINESLSQGLSSSKTDIHFVPWRGNFTRGIFISSQLHCDQSLNELYTLYEEYYHQHPFTLVSRETIFLKQVINTNKCLIQLEKAGTKLVVHTIIDNLLKGAGGQAVQNMNLMFNLEETTGLQLKAAAF